MVLAPQWVSAEDMFLYTNQNINGQNGTYSKDTDPIKFTDNGDGTYTFTIISSSSKAYTDGYIYFRIGRQNWGSQYVPDNDNAEISESGYPVYQTTETNNGSRANYNWRFKPEDGYNYKITVSNLKNDTPYAIIKMESIALGPSTSYSILDGTKNVANTTSRASSVQMETITATTDMNLTFKINGTTYYVPEGSSNLSVGESLSNVQLATTGSALKVAKGGAYTFTLTPEGLLSVTSKQVFIPTVKNNEVSVFFQTPSTFTSTPKAYVWRNEANGGETTNSAWPGVEMVKQGEDANGNIIWKWTDTNNKFSTSSLPSYIIITNGVGTNDADKLTLKDGIPFVNHGYYIYDGSATVAASDHVVPKETIYYISFNGETWSALDDNNQYNISATQFSQATKNLTFYLRRVTDDTAYPFVTSDATTIEAIGTQVSYDATQSTGSGATATAYVTETAPGSNGYLLSVYEDQNVFTLITLDHPDGSQLSNNEYYLVSPELTGGKLVDKFKFHTVRYRGNQIATNLSNTDDDQTQELTVKNVDLKNYSTTLNGIPLTTQTIHYYVFGKDQDGKVVEYRPANNDYELGATMTATIPYSYRDESLRNNTRVFNFTDYESLACANDVNKNSNYFVLGNFDPTSETTSAPRSYIFHLRALTTDNTAKLVTADNYEQRECYYYNVNNNTGTTYLVGKPMFAKSLAVTRNRGDLSSDNSFYLIGNIKSSTTNSSGWEWGIDTETQSSDDPNYKAYEFRPCNYADSTVYKITVWNHANNDPNNSTIHDFGSLYLQIAPSTLAGTDISTWSNNQNDGWNKTIRFDVPAERDATAYTGGLQIANDTKVTSDNTTVVPHNGQQAFNPDIDGTLYDHYNLYMNNTAHTYRIEFLTTPYISGPAVMYNWDESTGDITSIDGTDYLSNSHALVYNSDEGCYKYTGPIAHGQKFVFQVNTSSYAYNWHEDDNAPGSSNGENDYYNKVEYADGAYNGGTTFPSDQAITFNLGSDGEVTPGIYTIRFYIGTNGEGSYYTIDRPVNLYDMTRVSYKGKKRNIGNLLGEYKSYSSFADRIAYEKPANIDVYVVSNFEPAKQNTDGSWDPAKVTLTSVDYIPANTGVLLMSKKHSGKSGWDATTHTRTFTEDAEADSYASNVLTMTDSLVALKTNPLLGYTGSNRLVGVVDQINNLPKKVGTEINYLFGYRANSRKDYPYNCALGFWKFAGGKMSAHSAYMPLSENEIEGLNVAEQDFDGYGNGTNTQAKKAYLVMSIDNSIVTGIKDLKDVEETTNKDGYIYNLQGMRVERADRPGIYIRNGRKFVVK